jgi:hypothetical protein
VITAMQATRQKDKCFTFCPERGQRIFYTSHRTTLPFA